MGRTVKVVLDFEQRQIILVLTLVAWIPCLSTYLPAHPSGHAPCHMFEILPWGPEEEEEEGEGGFIACGGIEHSQSRPPKRLIPRHTDVVEDLVGRIAARTCY